MQKRILSILLCVFLVLSFAACGTTPENPTDTSGSSSGTTVNSSSGSGATSDSVSATDSVSSGTVTNSGTDSVTDVLSSGTTSSEPDRTDESGGAVDSAAGGNGDSGMGDSTDTSGSGDSSDFNPDDFYNSDSGTGILGSDNSTDTSGGYTDNSTNSGGGLNPDQTPEYNPTPPPDQGTDFFPDYYPDNSDETTFPDQDTNQYPDDNDIPDYYPDNSDETTFPDHNTGSGSGFNPGINDNTDNSSTTDTPLWTDTNSDYGPVDGTDSSGSGSNTQNPSDDTSSDGGGSGETVDITVGRKFLTTDITHHGIVVYDLDACKGDYQKLTDDRVSVFWEWTYSGDPNGRYNGPGSGIDSAKLRYSAYYGRDVVIACSSGGWAGVIDYENRTLLWESDASDLAGAHSLEMLPNGDLVVGTSGSNKVVYIPLSAGIEVPTDSISSFSTHGVSWDPTNKCLWILDHTSVYAVTVQNPGRNGKLQVVEGSVVDGFSGGHAFSPVAGSPGKYWIGAGSTVYQFDTKTKTITKASDVLQQREIKGITSFADGTVIFAAANLCGKATKTWSSDGFRIVTKDGTSTTVSFNPSHREFYKVQPFTRNYQ